MAQWNSRLKQLNLSVLDSKNATVPWHSSDCCGYLGQEYLGSLGQRSGLEYLESLYPHGRAQRSGLSGIAVPPHSAKKLSHFRKKALTRLLFCCFICRYQKKAVPLQPKSCNDMDLQLIDQQINEILNGTRDLLQFNQPEHAGVCSAGPLLVGALVVCDITREGLGTSVHVGSRQNAPTNWEIDEAQEHQVQTWAEAKGVWVEHADEWLEAQYGKMIAQGAESKVYCKTGDTAVIKLRTSIYATLGRALEAIALHNFLFPETIMRVIGFTRDTDGLFRIILIQPYIGCKRLATKEEIDTMVAAKGFVDNRDGNGVNYISERLHLEDMHPANVFVEEQTDQPICIDCIVKFI